MNNEQMRLMQQFSAMVADRMKTGIEGIESISVFSAIRVRNIMEYGAVREEDISEGAREQAISLMTDAGYTPDERDIFEQPMGDWAQTYLMMALLLMPRMTDMLEQRDRSDNLAESIISGEPL